MPTKSRSGLSSGMACKDASAGGTGLGSGTLQAVEVISSYKSTRAKANLTGYSLSCVVRESPHQEKTKYHHSLKLYNHVCIRERTPRPTPIHLEGNVFHQSSVYINRISDKVLSPLELGSSFVALFSMGIIVYLRRSHPPLFNRNFLPVFEGATV